MSRYDWPAAGRRGGIRRGQSGYRRAYNVGLNTGFGASEFADARALRHTADSDASAAEAAGVAGLAAAAAGSDHGADLIAMAAPPAGGPGADHNLWLPLGPAGTLRGSGDSDPRVAGRVRDLKVSRNGQRAYAVSAMGGLWYTDTAGARWEPVGAWAMVANPADLAAASHTLSGGAVHVRFDPGNDAQHDEVWVGTGEPTRSGRVPFETGVGGGQFAGVGVLQAVGPVAQNPADALVDPWTREAQPRPAAGATPAYPGLRGQAVYTIVADPTDDRHLVAGTSSGLHERVGAAADPWSLVTVAAWEALQAGISATVNVHDAVWLPATGGPGAHPARLWVTVVDAVAGLTGLWVSTAGTTGPFAPVALPGMIGATNRLGLAADPAAPDVLYVLGSGPRLWRVDGLVPAAVAPLPARLFGPAGNDRSGYNLAVAVDPGNINRVIVGGGAEVSPHDDSQAAALYRLTLGALGVVAGVPTYPTDFVAGGPADNTWIGAEVHPDVHRVRWSAVGGAGHVWVCCDGGIFRSTAAGAEGTFTSRSTGLAITEAGWVALHPLSDGVVLTGVQDNGVQLRIGEAVWRRAIELGDGGGVAFDPGAPGRFVAQAHRSFWDDDGGEGISPTVRRPDGVAGDAAFTPEHNGSRFYSSAAVLRRVDGVTQLAIGTTRVWYSERWGHSFQDGNVIRRHWDTLPAAGPAAPADPRAGDANDVVTNDFRPLAGPQPGPTGFGTGVHIVRWAGPDRLYVLQRGAVHRLDRNPALVGQWTRTTILTRAAPPAVAAAPAWPPAGAALPPIGALNDLAVHDAAAGPHGSFYVATSHPLESLWWFDGTATWHPVRLGTPAAAPPAGAAVPIPARGIRAPAYTVVLDPDDPTIVYVGTAVGVWRGVLTLPGPTWVWEPFNSGLPEAAVQDLSIGRWPSPEGGTLKLVRAALQARGIWEVEPDADVSPATFVRVHPYDSRRSLPTSPVDPMWHLPRPERDWPLDWADRRNRDHRTGAGRPRAAPDGTAVGAYPWHVSPDLRLRPAPRRAADPAVPPPADLPWTAVPTDRFALWSLQTALRTIDPLVIADGRWTAWFRSRLRAVRVALGIDAGPVGQLRVSAALWNHAQVQAGFWTEPWADGGPTETDLVERVVGMATPRTGGPTARASSPAGAAVLRRRYRVDVCVHHRGREPVAAGELAVVLLRVQLPADATTWAGMAPLTLPVGAGLLLLHADLDALPAAGGAVPARLVLPAGWAAADAGTPVRRPDRPATTGSPVVVSFDVDFSAAAARSRWLLVALAHSTADPVRLDGADVRAMVLGSRHAAARSVQVV